MVLGLLLVASFMFPIQKANATSAEIQTAEGHNSSNTSYTVSFSSSVTKGDLLVAMQGALTTSTTLGVSDSQGNTWSHATSQCTNACVEIWYATAGSTGSDTVTFTTTASSYLAYGFILEFRGGHR